MSKGKDVSQKVVEHWTEQGQKAGMTHDAAKQMARESAERVNRKRREEKR